MTPAGPCLMLVTARQRLQAARPGVGWEELLASQVRGALAGGIDLIQVREPDLDAATLARFLRHLFHTVPGSQARVVVNDRADVALAVGAAGVHLPERGLAPEAVRRIAPADWVVGRSVHGAESARASHGATLLVAGTVQASASKPGVSPLGLEGLADIVRAASGTPVIGIGGLTDKDVEGVRQAGAAGMAAIGYFVPDVGGDITAFVQERVMQLRLAFDSPVSVSYTQGSDR
ncbi:MAG: thiamine phosphate synthase [Vicinamibacterales bacterium]